MSEDHVFPGDRIAIIEEYETGENTFDDGHNVRSSVIGVTAFNKKDRMAIVKASNRVLTPRVNDIVIGSVDSVLSRMFAVTIYYINSIPTNAKIECINQLGDNKRRTVVRVGDLVTLRIISTLNGKVQSSIDESEFGVLFSKCIKCVGNVIRMGSGVKCIECGYVEERKLSSNFGNTNFLKLQLKPDK